MCLETVNNSINYASFMRQSNNFIWILEWQRNILTEWVSKLCHRKRILSILFTSF